MVALAGMDALMTGQMAACGEAAIAGLGDASAHGHEAVIRDTRPGGGTNLAKVFLLAGLDVVRRRGGADVVCYRR